MTRNTAPATPTTPATTPTLSDPHAPWPQQIADADAAIATAEQDISDAQARACAAALRARDLAYLATEQLLSRHDPTVLAAQEALLSAKAHLAATRQALDLAERKRETLRQFQQRALSTQIRSATRRDDPGADVEQARLARLSQRHNPQQGA